MSYDTAETSPLSDRVRAAGKFLRLGKRKFPVRGYSYGPFAPNQAGEHLPERAVAREDLELMRRLGANSFRVYFPPPEWLLDLAAETDLKVFVDVPWEKHRCFFEDWEAQETARQRVRMTARSAGQHPATLAISVVNEIPADVVRFYGPRRVQRFVEELIDVAKNESPNCLATFVNYPTTEYLQPENIDFHCFNVYLHDAAKLGAYLDRLQNIAGNRPLILGEYGIDTLRNGEQEQARLLREHIQCAFQRGLAGTFIFAFTDDWYTGGHQIDDWAFGVTRADRQLKPAAQEIAKTWQKTQETSAENAPSVSVVVCSYNGARTLRGCLESLMRVDYHDFEVILVDDGSRDATPQIAAEFPMVRYHVQENRGLSVARNVGARLAQGEIVAYTDDDCEVDEDWLTHLVRAMQEQKVSGIGGPNITPPDDGWTAKCVAASPGNPSHVMLDDHYAEHIPGCNMAFRRDVLLGVGGFDPQFRQAGDDVDLCWRLIDAGEHIGFAPAAMVWHHRRATIKAYLKQQMGYGRSEALVHFKHPQRCGTFGRSSWRGIIYGDGAVGLPLLPDTIYHGQFGLAPYQQIYRHNEYGLWSVLLSLEWHLVAVFLVVLSVLYWPLALVSAGLWLATLVVAVRSASSAPLPRRAPWWTRPLVGLLYVLQPIVRGWHRQTHLMRHCYLPATIRPLPRRVPHQRISYRDWDLYWLNEDYRGREQLLKVLAQEAPQRGWRGDFDDGWSQYDLKLVADCWHDIRVRTASEELGWPKRFTRARCTVHATTFSRIAFIATGIWIALSATRLSIGAAAAGLAVGLTIALFQSRSRRRCLESVTALVWECSKAAGLQPYQSTNGSSSPPASSDLSATTSSLPDDETAVVGVMADATAD